VLPLEAPRRVRGLMFRSISSKNRTPKARLVCYTVTSSIGGTTYQDLVRRQAQSRQELPTWRIWQAQLVMSLDSNAVRAD
jgi:hypothetical protein